MISEPTQPPVLSLVCMTVLQVLKLDRLSATLCYVVVLGYLAFGFSEVESSIFVNEADRLNKLIYSMIVTLLT